MREIAMAATDPTIPEVAFQASAQVAKTTLQLSLLGYIAHIQPSPVMVLLPTIELAKNWSKIRLTPMIEATPVLSEIFETGSRNDDNTTLMKSFPGGYIVFAGSNSPVNLSSYPVRYLLPDEVDRFALSAGKEGNPLSLAKMRTETFPDSKIIYTSTPGMLSTSNIVPMYLDSDQRKYYVPCPHCDEFQTLEWANCRWEPDAPQDAYMVCKHCAGKIEENDKAEFLRRGEWRAHAPLRNRAGFFINRLYSPFATFGKVVIDFLEAKRDETKEKLKVWTNTSLGEAWDDTQDAKPVQVDFEKRKDIEGDIVPRQVLVMTAGVDVQDDRLECEIVGWGDESESWSLQYLRIPGDPNDHEVWDTLDFELTRGRLNEDGLVLHVRTVYIDTGGHHSDAALKAAKARTGKGWYPILGSNTPGSPLNSMPRRAGKVRVNRYRIGTEAAKDALNAALKVEDHGPNFCHFRVDYEDEYFAQLLSEKRVYVFHRGVKHVAYKKLRARNEALDCRVYAYAALHLLPVRWEKWKAERVQLLADRKHGIDPSEVVENGDSLTPVEIGAIREIPASSPPAKKRKKGQYEVAGRGWRI